MSKTNKNFVARQQPSSDLTFAKTNLLHLLHYSETEHEWISTKWLKDWMNEKTETPPVDNSSLLCSHGK